MVDVLYVVRVVVQCPPAGVFEQAAADVMHGITVGTGTRYGVLTGGQGGNTPQA